MTDIATLGLEIRSDGVVVASNRLQQMTKDGKAAEGATSKLSSATSALTGYLKAAAAAFGLYKLAEYSKEAALLAARYQTLGVVMNTVGATAGYTNAQMAGFEKTLQKQGIAMVESRQVLTQMAQAHLDLAKASELGRVAQDAATIGGINSSEAFQRLVYGIQSAQPEMLRTIGINVNFEQSYTKAALALGKNRDALSESEKAQLRMNAALERGKDIAGVYEAAMGTAGKQLTSMKRYIDNLKVTAGSVFNDILIVGVQAYTGVLKEANTEAEKLQQQNKLAEAGKQIVMAMATAADGLRIVVLAIQTVGVAIGATAAKVYFAFNTISSAIRGDFQDAKNSLESLISVNSDAAKAISDLWANPTKFQDAAKAMYAQRDANKAAEESAKKALEAKQMAAGAAAKQSQAEDELALLIKKHRDEWSNIVVEQLESKGLYVEAVQEQIRMNKLTDEYKTMLNAANESQEAMNALKAQELLDQQRLFDAKQRELDLDIQKKNEQTSAYQQLIDVKRALGQDTKATESDQLSVAYAKKKMEIEYAINEAANKGNDLAESINSQLLNQLDALYAQKDINSQGMDQLRQILGLQQSITSEMSKQKDSGSALVDEYNSSITISRTKDEQYANDKYITSGIGRLQSLMFYGGGPWFQYVQKMAEDRAAAAEREKAETKLIEDQKLLVEAIENAADRLSQASVNLANSGGDLAKALRAAQANLLMARVDLAGSSTSTLSPEQQLAMLRAQFTQTAATAQSTGDVNLFNQLPELARQLLEASQAYNASGAGFTADYDLVQQILGESADSAGSYASSAEQMVTLLQQQANLLTAIKAALETGGDTAELLAQLNTVNGQVVSTLGTVNTSVGQTTAAANATATAVWTDKAVSDAINAQVANNTTSTANWLNAVNSQTAAVGSYTARTRDVLNGSLMASQLSGRVQKVTTTANGTVNGAMSYIDTYTYYAKGGIANDPTGRSIFGEAGPEAAVPLPDGRTIPVTLYGASDGYDKELMQEILAELKALTRVQVAGNNGIIAPLQGMEKRLRGVENKARLAANQ